MTQSNPVQYSEAHCISPSGLVGSDHCLYVRDLLLKPCKTYICRWRPCNKPFVFVYLYLWICIYVFVFLYLYSHLFFISSVVIYLYLCLCICVFISTVHLWIGYWMAMCNPWGRRPFVWIARNEVTAVPEWRGVIWLRLTLSNRRGEWGGHTQGGASMRTHTGDTNEDTERECVDHIGGRDNKWRKVEGQRWVCHFCKIMIYIDYIYTVKVVEVVRFPLWDEEPD